MAGLEYPTDMLLLCRLPLLRQLGGMTDVKNKRCERLGCGKTPNFADEGQKPRFCSAHKLPHHVNVKGER